MRKRRVLFIDRACPKPYSTRSLDTEPLGGTEATVIRVADALSRDGCDVTVMQHCRSQADGNYKPLDLSHDKWDAIVIVRDASLVASLRAKFPHLPLTLWLHDISGPSTFGKALAKDIEDAQPYVVTVSDWHKTQTVEYFQSVGMSRWPKIKRIYNPVTAKRTDACSIDHNRLIFFSSPHKGLDYAVRTFKNLLNFKPELRLWVANPGYLATPELSHPSIDVLGPLPHSEVIKHVEASFCVWYPNFTFPETFGLVLAEASAVGTPVLTHALGAASEVLKDPSQLVDVRNPKFLIDRFLSWHDRGRPHVSPQPDFSLEAVTAAWKHLLFEAPQ